MKIYLFIDKDYNEDRKKAKGMKNKPNYLCLSATKSQNITVDFGTAFSTTAAFQVHSHSRASSYD